MRVVTQKGRLITPHQVLAGKSVVVTGASSGIGRAIAERLGAEGAFVDLSGRDNAAMEESAARIKASGGDATIVVADVRDLATMANLVDVAVKARGQLDVFVNNAGVSFLSPILETDVESWRLMQETNVLALLVGSQAAVRSMRATGTRGHIVNISSVAARSPDSGVYGATKHAVNVISNSLRQELLEDPIQITTIMPGLVATNIGRYVDAAAHEGLLAMSGVEYTVVAGERPPDEILEKAQKVLNEIMIKPSEIADAVYYALSQPASVQVSEIVVRPNKDFDL
ncbi:MAG TPA: SDR family oxidoreductase [Acidimicrobiales bacterium]